MLIGESAGVGGQRRDDANGGAIDVAAMPQLVISHRQFAEVGFTVLDHDIGDFVVVIGELPRVIRRRHRNDDALAGDENVSGMIRQRTRNGRGGDER